MFIVLASIATTLHSLVLTIYQLVLQILKMSCFIFTIIWWNLCVDILSHAYSQTTPWMNIVIYWLDSTGDIILKGSQTTLQLCFKNAEHVLLSISNNRTVNCSLVICSNGVYLFISGCGVISARHCYLKLSEVIQIESYIKE